MYNLLKNSGPLSGVPKIYDFGTDRGKSCLVMKKLGKTLDQDLKEAGRLYCKSYILELGIQLINGLRFIHDRGIIDRDIRPDNTLFGSFRKKGGKLHVVDFNLAREET